MPVFDHSFGAVHSLWFKCSLYAISFFNSLFSEICFPERSTFSSQKTSMSKGALIIMLSLIYPAILAHTQNIFFFLNWASPWDRMSACLMTLMMSP